MARLIIFLYYVCSFVFLFPLPVYKIQWAFSHHAHKKRGFTFQNTQNLTHPPSCVSMATEFSPRDITESNHDLPSPSEFLYSSRRCCFCIPYQWQKVRSSSPEYNSERSLWSRGIDALMKIREWSEIVAGPRWKTFIRRFNRNKSFGRQSPKFQYDPLDYALNFDEGALDNGDSEMENEYMVRNFSSRYASRTTVPITSKPSTDLGKEAIGPNFV